MSRGVGFKVCKAHILGLSFSWSVDQDIVFSYCSSTTCPQYHMSHCAPCPDENGLNSEIVSEPPVKCFI